MKATELRIGNWIYEYHSEVMVREISETHYKGLGLLTTPNSIGATHGGIFSPIPLTEEWLVRLGFKRTPHDGHPPYGYINGFFISCEEDNAYWQMEIGGSSDGDRNHWVKLHSVHQLQNLYFALTGEELVIKT